jgi:hypothetical protein
MLGVGGKSYRFALDKTTVSLAPSRTTSRSAENFSSDGGRRPGLMRV